MKKLLNLFKEYFTIYFEYCIDFKLNEDINILIHNNINDIILSFITEQKYDIDNININNIDIEKYLYQYVDKNFLQLKQIIKKIIDNKLVNLRPIQIKLSKLICDYIYPQISKIINDNVENDLIHAINSFKIDDKFCYKHFNILLSDKLNLSPTINLVLDKDWQELLSYATDIYDQLHIKDKNKYLLELDNDDKINQYYGEINYDPHNVSFRDGPIVVYRDKNNKDHVEIGKYGDFHHELVLTNFDGIHYGRGYWYKPCAFIDYKNQLGYNIDELIQILYNDSRIKKVYLAPENSCGGKLMRLAINKNNYNKI